MRGLAVVALAPALISPVFAAKPAVTELVTVAQVEQILKSAHERRDGALAARLSEMKLTERLSIVRLGSLEAGLPGRRSREALRALADESVFLDLPREEVPPEPAPVSAVRTALLAKALDYFENTVPHGPSFTALRTVDRFEGTATVIPGGLQDDLHMPDGIRWYASPVLEHWECPGRPKMDHRRLSVIERSTATVFHRGGHTLRVMSGAGEFACSQGGLNTADEMGEIAVAVPIILSHDRALWSHWERGAAGPVAVFQYAAMVTYQGSAGAHASGLEMRGEIALDPRDGAIVRLTEIRRWKEGPFVKEYDTEVEFGRVTIEGRTLMFPVRRTAMFLVPAMRPRSAGGHVEDAYRKYHLEESPLQEYLNDVTFSNYRAYVAPAGSPEAGTVTASIH